MAISDNAKEELLQVTDLLNELYQKVLIAFDERDLSILPDVEVIEERIDDLSKELELRHIDRVKQGSCTAQTGSIYLQTVSNLERVGDHITNIAFSIKQYAPQKV